MTKNAIFEQSPCLKKDEIRQYLRGSLNDDQRYRVENHLLDCPLCSDAVEGYATHYDFETDFNIERLQKKIRPAEESKEKQLTPQRLFTIRNIAAAILLLLLPLAALYYLNDTKEKALFSTHFNATRVPEFVVRSSDDAIGNELTQAIEFYKQEAIESSRSLLDGVLEKDPENSTALFYHGLIYLEENDTQAALDVFTTLRVNDPLRYEDATWYLILANLQKGDQKEAKILLDELLQSKDNVYEKRAKALLKALQ